MLDSGVDIVVTSPAGHRTLLVQVKRYGGGIAEGTSQLRDYMQAVGADVGLVVVPDRIRILRETYRGEPSIQVVGEFPIQLADDLAASGEQIDFVDFEDRVQRWLESLRDHEQTAAEPLRTALIEHVLPSLVEGTVRAARPRIRRAAG